MGVCGNVCHVMELFCGFHVALYISGVARLRQGAHFTAKIAGNGPRINGSLQLCLI